MDQKHLFFIGPVFILLLILDLSTAAVQQEAPDEQEWWQIGFDKGMELLNAGKLKEA
jgi:hypothetical protein